MKIKTDELIGKALDWAVAKALGHALKIRTWKDITDTLDPTEDADIIAFHKERNTVRVSAEQIPGGGWFPNPRYSTDGNQGGPIIEREKYNAPVWDRLWQQWSCPDPKNAALGILGPTLLVAAMRCFVCARIGKEVDVPDELLTESDVATESAPLESERNPQRPRGV
jgi:hypothetical protein